MEWISFAPCGEKSHNRVRTAAGTGCVGIRLLSMKGWQGLCKQGGVLLKQPLPSSSLAAVTCGERKELPSKSLSLSKKVAVGQHLHIVCLHTCDTDGFSRIIRTSFSWNHLNSTVFSTLLHSPNLLSLILKEQTPTYTSHLGDSC